VLRLHTSSDTTQGNAQTTSMKMLWAHLPHITCILGLAWLKVLFAARNALLQCAAVRCVL
jgi:hypothetical protein